MYERAKGFGCMDDGSQAVKFYTAIIKIKRRSK
jgi:hypothetical protein